VLARVGVRSEEPVDLAALLRDIAHRAGVRCAVDNDLGYVSLLMLHGVAAAGSAVQEFYSRCIDRHVTGRPLLVRSVRDADEPLGYESLRFADDDPR
jgi:hypothetical protein